MPDSLGSAIFFWTAICFIILYFVVMIVDFFVWLARGRPISVNPVVVPSPPVNDNNIAPKVAQ